MPGNSFFPDGVTGRNSMRINFSYESPENIAEAIRRLAGVIDERLELYRAFIKAGAIKVDPETRAAIESYRERAEKTGAAAEEGE